ncbi:unnamed protein product [Leuciscus chuanchicus]
MDSEQVHDLHHRDRTPGSNPSSSSSSTAEKHLPHRLDEKKPEGEQLPISRLKRKSQKKKEGDFNFFKSLSFRWKKESPENKSSDQGEMMKDQETETSRRNSLPTLVLIFSSLDQKSLQSIFRSLEVIDLEEPVNDPEVLPAAEPLVQEELQTRLTAGETSPLHNEMNMRPPEDDICCRYAIGRKLGQGGFAAVYEGTPSWPEGLTFLFFYLPQLVTVKFIRKTKHMECISIVKVTLTILASKKGPAMDIIKLLDFYVMVLERFSHCMDVFDFVKSNGG